MSHIVIPIPIIIGKQDIEIQVTINHEMQSLYYKLELFYCYDCFNPPGDLADSISEMLYKHDSNWEVYFIGSHKENFVPITFVEKKSKELMKMKNC